MEGNVVVFLLTKMYTKEHTVYIDIHTTSYHLIGQICRGGGVREEGVGVRG